MKEAFNLAIRLFVITAVATIALAFINKSTSSVIAERQAQELKEALVVAYPEGQDFEEMDESELNKYIGEKSPIKAVYNVNGGEGHVYQVSSKGGYGGAIEFIVGIKDGKTIGYSTLSHSEAPGFGAEITEPEFAEGVKDVVTTGNVGYSTSPDENEIQAISGATITTKCITNGINAAADVDNQINQ